MLAPTLVAWLLAGPDHELLEAKAEALSLASVAPGERAELSLRLLETPTREWPLSVRIESSALALVDDRLDWSAVVDPLALQPRLSVPFTAPDEPGRYEARANLSYAVCNEQWCWPRYAELRWTVEVLAPAPS